MKIKYNVKKSFQGSKKKARRKAFEERKARREMEQKARMQMEARLQRAIETGDFPTAARLMAQG